jgi:hypothetical protein
MDAFSCCAVLCRSSSSSSSSSGLGSGLATATGLPSGIVPYFVVNLMLPAYAPANPVWGATVEVSPLMFSLLFLLLVILMLLIICDKTGRSWLQFGTLFCDDRKDERIDVRFKANSICCFAQSMCIAVRCLIVP